MFHEIEFSNLKTSKPIFKRIFCLVEECVVNIVKSYRCRRCPDTVKGKDGHFLRGRNSSIPDGCKINKTKHTLEVHEEYNVSWQVWENSILDGDVLDSGHSEANT